MCGWQRPHGKRLLSHRVGRRLYAGLMSWPRNLNPGPGGGLYTGAGGGMSESRGDGARALEHRVRRHR